MEPKVWFVTPVHQRAALTKICLEQRRRMLDALPFEAYAVAIGDDVNMEAARVRGIHCVEHKNDFVGRKFNAGYHYAQEHGATHIMAIGSDSWLHPSAFEGAVWDKKAISLVGLSSFSPLGDERLDLGVKYPAGFGVGMVYPAGALRRDPCEPSKQFGCDISVWSRNGRGKIGIEFLELRPHTYINFHSSDVQITDYKSLTRAFNRIINKDTEDPLGPLRELYDDDLVASMEELYALRSLEVFLTRARREPYSPKAVLTRDKKTGKLIPKRKWLPPAEARRLQERARRRQIQLHGEDTTVDRFRAILGRPGS